MQATRILYIWASSAEILRRIQARQRHQASHVCRVQADRGALGDYNYATFGIFM